MGHVQRQEITEASGKTRVRWQARYRGPDGKERTKRFDRKAEAQAWLNRHESNKAEGTWTDPRAGRVTFREWVQEWQPLSVGLRESTQSRHQSLLENQLLPVFGDTPLARIDNLAVRRFVADLDAKGLAPSTVRKAHALLSKVLQAAVDTKRIPTNPARGVPLPSVEQEEMRFLTTDEIDRLASTAPERYRVFVLVGAYGGLRLSELAGLRKHRVDPLKGRVRVVETLVESRGGVYEDEPKTKAGRRTVALPRFVAQELGEHMGRFSESGTQGHVFTAPKGGPLRAKAFRGRVWTPATEAAGLEGLRMHDLRHTAVSLWIAAGAHPREVATRAGHSSVAFTLDRYGHLFPEADDELAGRLDALHEQREGGDTDTDAQ